MPTAPRVTSAIDLFKIWPSILRAANLIKRRNAEITKSAGDRANLNRRVNINFEISRARFHTSAVIFSQIC